MPNPTPKRQLIPVLHGHTDSFVTDDNATAIAACLVATAKGRVARRFKTAQGRIEIRVVRGVNRRGPVSRLRPAKIYESKAREALHVWLSKTATTQIAMSAKFGMSKTWCIQIIRGVSQPSLGIAIELEQLTGIPCRDWKVQS